MLRADITVAEFGASPRKKQSGEENGFVQWLRANVLWVFPFTLAVFLFVACIVTITVYAVLTAPPVPPSPPSPAAASSLPSPPPAAASPPPPPPDGHCDTLINRDNCYGAGTGTDQAGCELLGCCWHTDPWNPSSSTHDPIACFKRVVSGSVFPPPPPSLPTPYPPPPLPSPPPPWPPRTSVTQGCHTIRNDPCLCCSSVDGRTETGSEWVQNAPLCRPAQTGQSFGAYSNTCEVEAWLNTNPTELAKADDCSTISGC